MSISAKPAIEPETRFCREKEQVYRGTDRFCFAPSGAWYACGGGYPQDGYHRADVLPLEATVRRMGLGELRRLRQLEEENSRLKRMVADLSLDKAMLQDVLSKKL